MKKFNIVFKHKVVIEYSTTIEADTEEDAKEIFNESPFENGFEEVDTDGIDLWIESISELKNE